VPAHDNSPGLRYPSYELGKQITSDGQPFIYVQVRNDRPEVDAAVRGVPKDLVHVDVHQDS
jgi:hypothetical protein